MSYVAAFVLAVLALEGKNFVTFEDVEKILISEGIEFDAKNLALTIKLLKGKNLEELEKLSALPVGGGAAAPAAATPAAATPAAAGAAPATAAAEKKMRYVAAFLLAVLGGKEAVTFEDVEKILISEGIEFDAENLALTIKLLKGKNLEELEKLSALPVGGGAAAPAAATPAAAGAAPATAAAEKKVDKKKEESDENSEGDDMGFGLFQ